MNSLNITKLTFDVSSLGPEALLTAVRPYYAYLDGERTSTVDGYKYTTAVPAHGFATLDIKIPGEKRMDVPPSEYIAVKYDNLMVKLYRDNNGKYQLTAKAENVHKAEAKRT